MLATKNLLLILRHAKSDKSGQVFDDFDRPLNAHGELQPAKIAEQLNELGIDIHLALVSPALRTTQTFELLAERLPHPPSPIFDQRIYNAEVDDIISVLEAHQGYGDNVMVVGHNPALSQIVSILINDYCELGTAHLAILKPKKATIFESLKTNSFTLIKKLNP